MKKYVIGTWLTTRQRQAGAGREGTQRFMHARLSDTRVSALGESVIPIFEARLFGLLPKQKGISSTTVKSGR